MTPRVKKLFATLLIILVWLPAYALVVMGVAVHVLAAAAWYVSLVFYALAGRYGYCPSDWPCPGCTAND